MNNKNVAIGFATLLTVVAILVAVYLYSENRFQEKRIAELEEDRLRLIKDSLRNNPNLSDEVKIQLRKLIDDFVHIDQNVASELTQALQLFQIGQVENAIEDLVKIIGHILEQHYTRQPAFKNWFKKEKKNKSHIDIHDLLTYCHKEDKKINDIEYQFFIAIKTIRNKEAHQVNFKLDGYLTASGIITAIGAIVKVSQFVYPLPVLSEDQLVNSTQLD